MTGNIQTPQTAQPGITARRPRDLFRPGVPFKLLLAIENDDNVPSAILLADALADRGAVPSWHPLARLEQALGENTATQNKRHNDARRRNGNTRHDRLSTR